MSTITLPNIRVSSDLTVSVRLKDNGVAIDWSTLNNVKASIYSDAQRALAGRCGVSVDAEDPTVLVCQYAANKPQYVGVCRIVVSAKYMGETKTYDKPAFSFVRWTADQDGEQITIDDPDVDVEIDVADVSSSLLDEAIRAAFTAAEEAVDAKGQVLETEAEVEAAEALRVSAEESRVEAEEGRAEAEAARVDEEAVRVSAEDARVVAENARAVAEDLREGAEDDRAAAETARETAEAARVAAEALRVTAEGSRETAEAAREAQASADHTVAAGDHTQAAADHTQAAADHTTAASDHTQAGADHTLAAADHVTAGEDHAQALDDHEVMAGYDTRLGNVESEVSQLEAKVSEVVLPTIEGKTITLDGTIGATISLTLVNESGWRCVLKECIEGDSFTITGKGGIHTRLWGFVDSDRKLIAVSASNLTGTNLQVVAPSGAAYFISNSSTPLTVVFKGKNSLPDIVDKVDEILVEYTFDAVNGIWSVGRSVINDRVIYPSYTSYRYHIFDAIAGDVISYKGTADSNTSILAKQDADGIHYTNIVAGTGSSISGEYTVVASGKYVICGYNNYATAASITRNGRLMTAEEQISELQTIVENDGKRISGLEENYTILDLATEIADATGNGYISYPGGVVTSGPDGYFYTAPILDFRVTTL